MSRSFIGYALCICHCLLECLQASHQFSEMSGSLDLLLSDMFFLFVINGTVAICINVEAMSKVSTSSFARILLEYAHHPLV